MTVKQLIEALQKMPQDVQVEFEDSHFGACIVEMVALDQLGVEAPTVLIQ